MGILVQIRAKCKTCSRSAPPSEMVGGVCIVCLNERAVNYREKFAAMNLRECAECHHCMYSGEIGYVHWDVTARHFALLCRPCASKAAHFAAQYRNTESAYRTKAQ